MIIIEVSECTEACWITFFDRDLPNLLRLTVFLAVEVERRHILVCAGSHSASNFCRHRKVGGAGM